MAEEGATVEESAMLGDNDTGRKREVDVLIRGLYRQRAHADWIEATARANPVDVKWVEAEVGKHRVW